MHCPRPANGEERCRPCLPIIHNGQLRARGCANVPLQFLRRERLRQRRPGRDKDDASRLAVRHKRLGKEAAAHEREHQEQGVSHRSDLPAAALIAHHSAGRLPAPALGRHARLLTHTLTAPSRTAELQLGIAVPRSPPNPPPWCSSPELLPPPSRLTRPSRRYPAPPAGTPSLVRQQLCDTQTGATLE